MVQNIITDNGVIFDKIVSRFYQTAHLEQELLTFLEHLRSPQFFLIVLVGFMGFRLLVFVFLIPCCYVCFDFCIKMSFSHLFYLFVIIYIYWCPTRFPYEMMFVITSLVSSNTSCFINITISIYLHLVLSSRQGPSWS